MNISPRVKRRIYQDFGFDQSNEVIALIERLDLTSSSQDEERLAAAVVLAADKSVAGVRDAIHLATVDWRDLLVNGGVGNENWPAVLDQQFGTVFKGA